VPLKLNVDVSYKLIKLRKDQYDMNTVLGDTSSAYSFELKLLLSRSDNRDSVLGRHLRPDGLPTTTRAVSNSRVCERPREWRSTNKFLSGRGQVWGQRRERRPARFYSSICPPLSQKIIKIWLRFHNAISI